MNPTRPTIKTEFFPILLIVLSAIGGVYFRAHAPAVVPSHWDIHNNINGYSSSLTVALLFPLLLLGIYLLFSLIPYVDPRRQRYEEFRKPYHIFKNIIMLFIAIFAGVAWAQSLGKNIPINIVPALIGLMFVLLGNYMGKLRFNWFMGIRTPWTLSNEEVWNRTHRLGGKVFVLGGILIVLDSVLQRTWNFSAFIVIILAIVLIPTLYSWRLYSKIQGDKLP